ncbi:MAG TPA: hypothetical protein VGF14_01665 [Alphaproteobacteria bacterium]
MVGLFIITQEIGKFNTGADEIAKQGARLFLAFVSYPLLWAVCLYGMPRGFAATIKGNADGDTITLLFLSFTAFVGLNATMHYIYA